MRFYRISCLSYTFCKDATESLFSFILVANEDDWGLKKLKELEDENSRLKVLYQPKYTQDLAASYSPIS